MRELELQELQAYCPLGIDLEKEIGHGSYGRVYKLKNRDEVIKVLDPAMSCPDRRLEPKDYEQFQTELDYACRITHLKNPNLMPVSGIHSCVIQPQGDEKRMIFMLRMPLRKNLMELAEEKIKSGAQPNEDDIIRIVCDLCHGLESLHQEKVVVEGKGSTMEKFSIPGPLIHGDIKPANVFIHNESNAVRYYQLGDFGACFRTGSGWIPGQKLYSNTHYTAPESSDDEISPAYDVFSLGFMLYWWMNGWQHPEKARKARFDSDFEQRFRLSNMSPEIWRVFKKATDKSWRNRFATAAEMRDCLEKAQKARNQRTHEAEKKDIEIVSLEKGKGEGKAELLKTEAKIAGAITAAALVGKAVSSLIGSDSEPKRSYGEYQYAKGIVYKGEVYKGKANGNGSLHYSNGVVFTGIWKAGLLQESFGGTFVFPDGSKYSGEMKNGLPGGQGVYTTCSGRDISGKWGYASNKTTGHVGLLLNGLPAGQGDYFFPDGSKYSGEFWNGQIEGRGDYTACDGSVYSGEWRYVENENGYSGMLLEGKCCGQGKQSYPTGGCYCGEFKNGFPDGKGSYYTKGGERFTGNWDYFRNPEYKTNGLRLNGHFCGYAEIYYRIESWHIGEFRDGAPCGPGVYIAKNGTRMQGIWSHQSQTRKSDYTGTILNGMKNGWGELNLRNGNKYIGEFMNDEITGWGMHYDKHGSLLREGYWQNGSPIG